ncbi:MAG TPA: TIM barrel protein [Gemmataceae bacterium]|jgi:hydroxypyruvate isomerase
MLDRRTVLKAAGVATLGALAAPALVADEVAAKSGLKQSVCRWCYGQIPIDKLADECVKLGYKSVELLSQPQDVSAVQSRGLTCAVYGKTDIVRGLNREAHHPKILKLLRENIEFAAAHGLPKVICMAGNRTLDGHTVSDEEGMDVCAKGLKQVVGLAEEKKVTLIMEGLNSKVNHKDYMYDKTEWGVKLCQKVGSPRFKLLYDIYHMQIMEGDVIATVRKYKDYIAHYHTGGVPGRHEIDDTQELNYAAIVRAILDTGYASYLGQEFIPKRDPFVSMAQAYKICNV